MKNVDSNHFTGDPIVAKYSRLNEQITSSGQPTPAQMKAVQSYVKKRLGVGFTGPASWTPVRRGNGVYGTASLPPDKGIHGRLVKGYDLYIDCWPAEDNANGPYNGFRLNLQWSYTVGGTNGHSAGTLFVKPDGKVIQERDE